MVSMTTRARRDHHLLIAWVAGLTLGANGSVAAQEASPPVAQVVQAGRSLRVTLHQRGTVTQVSQRLTGALIEPVYACDRVVVPAGTKILGHVSRLDGP